MDREIYFAGGCFWGTEHFFKQINGVTVTQVGYANGNIENPTYEQVYTEDEKTVTKTLSELQRNYEKPIVVENEPLKNFYSGEEYHQDYLDKNPSGYCHINPELFELAKKANLR